MGWTTTHKPSHISAKEYIETNCLTWDSPTHDYRVLDGGVKNFRTYYGAVEKTDRSTGERQVFAVIFMLQFYKNDYHNFGYKDMDESVGPYQAECPERILKLLTPTTSQYAQQWRDACWAKINAKKTKPVINVGTALTYGGVNYVVNMVLGRRGYQVINPQGRVYRLKKTQAAAATII
jgi:hypothetical protein